MTKCYVAIIGAGPYGLSIAAHLKDRGVAFRIFGSPMRTWLKHMPKGMRLKSEGFASSLYDPDSRFTLGTYCKEQGIAYADMGLPVPLETFTSYGLEFQKRFVSELEDRMVVSVERASPGFEICLDDGETVAARKVVVAVGISHFQYLPEVLSGLSEDYVTHSSRHSSLEGFKGREIIVVGAGASALDLAALLHQAKASVHLVARRSVLRFHSRGQIPRPLLQRIRHPTTGVGPGWKSLFITKAPLVFRQLPERFRLDFVSRYLGPAPCWFVKDEVVGKVPFHLGVNLGQPQVQNGRLNVPFIDGSGSQRTLVTDHIIAATGYRVDLRRLKFLKPQVLKEIRSVSQTPVLSSNFESSVDGLYFVGATSANTFGPLLRFAYGAGFAARRITNHLARSAAYEFPQVHAEPELIEA